MQASAELNTQASSQKDEEAQIEEEQPFKEIEELTNHGINGGDIIKLKAAGLCTIKGCLMMTKKEMLNIRGITEAKAEKIFEVAAKIEQMCYRSGLEILEQRKHIKRISLGAKSLDLLLEGGIESQSITEAFGEFRTGKTQMSHTLCVTAQLPKSQGGGQGKVLFIDTENTFRPERIMQISKRFEVDGNEVLSNIMVGRAFTVDSLFTLLMKAAAAMVEDTYSLLIIDSIMAPFRVDFSGRGELSERQQVLGRFLKKVQMISEQFNVAVFLTNQVMADPGATMSYAVDPKKPIGGHILAHASTTRLFLRKGKGEQRVCKIFDSPSIAESEAIYQLDAGGLIDPID